MMKPSPELLQELERNRTRASPACDVPPLRSLLRPDFVFTDSNGRINASAGYLELPGSGGLAHVQTNSTDHDVASGSTGAARLLMHLGLTTGNSAPCLESGTLVSSGAASTTPFDGPFRSTRSVRS